MASRAVFPKRRGKLDTLKNTVSACDQVSKGKLGVQTFDNLSIFNGKIISDLMSIKGPLSGDSGASIDLTSKPVEFATNIFTKGLH